MKLNQRAAELCRIIIQQAVELQIDVNRSECGTRLIDLGVNSPGGLEAGCRLAEVCTAGLAKIELSSSLPELWSGPSVTVSTDHPVRACMASQYAGWEVKGEKYFAMGSGPMRACYAQEELFQKIGCQEQSDVVVGVLESDQFPPDDLCQKLAKKCNIKPEDLTLLIAPTSSQAGNIQVVARSVETTLHKLYELGFDLQRIASGYGRAPLPPVASDQLTGIGRTNDAILYGGEVMLWLRGDDDSIKQLGPKIPSSASADYGKPFKQIFKKYDGDFYQIDPMLFSPAVVTINNLDTGNTFRFGNLLPRVIHESFGVQ